MKVLICRPAEDAKALVELVADKDIRTLALPTIEIKDLEATIRLADFSDFIFTSKHAVKSFFAQHNAKLLTDKSIYCIGAATTKELKGFALGSQYPEKHNSKALFNLIKKSPFTDKKFVIISGVGGNTYLEDEISKYAFVKKFTVYERVLVDKEFLQNTYNAEYSNSEPDLIVATSIDVFKSLVRIFKETSLPAEAKVTITSPKMLKFVLESGFNRTLELKQIDNAYISKQIISSL